MNTHDVLYLRMQNQGLIHSKFTTPDEVVKNLGAVQSQDYRGAKWALGQRITTSNDAAIEQAFTDGKILRTHVMRPTWHFVDPQDISWMLQLTGPRVEKVMSSYNKKLELNDEVFTKSQHVITTLLTREKVVIRQEIKNALDEAGIKTDVQRLAHIVMQAEIDQIIISGPKRGSQFTYMLFSDRVPKTKHITHDEALMRLTHRYFTSHGPALILDFVWWSGLTVIDAKKGIEMNGKKLSSIEIDGKTYYLSSDHDDPPTLPHSLFLLPNYDEFTIAYKDRSAFYIPNETIKIYSMGMLAFPHVIVQNGKVIGVWRREIQKNSANIRAKFISKPDKSTEKIFQSAVTKYSKFLGVEVKVKEIE